MCDAFRKDWAVPIVAIPDSIRDSTQPDPSNKGSLENIPPTKDALLQHILRVIYQASIWFTSHERMPLIPSPEGKGWVLESNQLKPVWMTKPVAAKVCKTLVRCHCQSEKGCRFCKCIKLGLTCTERCRCFCN